LEKSKISSIYQNRFPNLSTRKINELLWFVVIVISYFSSTGLVLKVLRLSEKNYRIYEAKESVINVEITGEKINLKR
jgi:hypothetical protein